MSKGKAKLTIHEAYQLLGERLRRQYLCIGIVMFVLFWLVSVGISSGFMSRIFLAILGIIAVVAFIRAIKLLKLRRNIRRHPEQYTGEQGQADIDELDLLLGSWYFL